MQIEVNSLWVGFIQEQLKVNSVDSGELIDYFSQFGPLIECRMIFDKVTRRFLLTLEKFRGFCFVTFRDEETADRVLEVKTHTIKGQNVTHD